MTAPTRSAVLLLTACLWPLPLQGSSPPLCDAGGGSGGYRGALVTPVTRIGLDASGSTDPDPGTQLDYRWQLIAGSGSFDDPAALRPELRLDTPLPCVTATAMLKLTVSDGSSEVSCFAAVEAAERRDCPLQMVVLMDTSSSMFDDATAICANLGTVVSDLRAQGITVAVEMLGITSTTPASIFTCLGGHVRGNFADPRVDQSEDWGPATEVVAERSAWLPDHVRLIVPISDEGPQDGEPCFDPGSDRDSISAASAAANAHGVLVSPIASQGASAQVIRLGRDLATVTRGTHFVSSAPTDLAGALKLLVQNACAAAQPVSCSIAPPAPLSCSPERPLVTVELDGSGSQLSCARGGLLWTTDCPGGVFDDPASPRPRLSLPTRGPGCRFDCQVSLLVSEGSRTASCSETVHVVDDAAPVIDGIAFDGACLWPPNHKYVCFDAEQLRSQVTTRDCSAVSLRVVGCRSDQPDDAPERPRSTGNGDGHTVDDCLIQEDRKGFCVRAERLGSEPAGRHYAVEVEATDACANSAIARATLHVPHDRSPASKNCLEGSR